MSITLYILDTDRAVSVKSCADDAEVGDYLHSNWENINKAELYQFDSKFHPKGNWYRAVIENREVVRGFYNYRWESWSENKLPNEVKLAMLLQNA